MDNKNKSNSQQQNKNQSPSQLDKKKPPSTIKSKIFFALMLLSYLLLYFVYPIKVEAAFLYVFGIIRELLPILVLVYIFMVLFSLVNEKKLKKIVEGSPMLLQYVIMSLLGTLSHGPIYAWYPFLKALNQKGISKGTIATFLYARGIKLTLLPMLIAFFDLKFVILLTITTLFFSIIEGIIIDFTSKVNLLYHN